MSNINGMWGDPVPDNLNTVYVPLNSNDWNRIASTVTLTISQGEEPVNEGNIDQIFRDTFTECCELMIRKQHDYGPKNIESFGTVGVLVRLSDKMARLQNLLSQDAIPNEESLEDTWKDIANYGIIGLLLHRDKVFHPTENYRLTRD